MLLWPAAHAQRRTRVRAEGSVGRDGECTPLLRPVAADLTTTIRAAETPVRLHQDELVCVWMVAGRCIVGARFSESDPDLRPRPRATSQPLVRLTPGLQHYKYNDGIGLVDVVVRRSRYCSDPSHTPEFLRATHREKGVICLKPLAASATTTRPLPLGRTSRQAIVLPKVHVACRLVASRDCDRPAATFSDLRTCSIRRGATESVDKGGNSCCWCFLPGR